MKPLTIEELKALKVGDWVWVVNKERDDGFSRYAQQLYKNDFDGYHLADYGTKWLAYKNKEMAECKGEIVELPCILKSNSTYPKNQVVYINEFGSIIVERFSYEQDAERRLAELRGEK